MSKPFFQHDPLIFTVGGGEPGRPMDTLRNFKNAIDSGCDVIQSNISFTADGKLVLHSDAIYLNTRIKSGGIETRRRSELVALFNEEETEIPVDSGGEGALFPELDSALQDFPEQRYHFFLTGGNPRLAQAFLESIDAAGAADRILVSAGRSIIRIIRSARPDIATAFTLGGVLVFYALFKTGLIGIRKKFPADALILPETIGVSYIANPGLIHEAKMRGIRTYILDVNGDAAARRFLESGADGLVTKNAPLIRSIISR
ncbi:MAG: hypothetical protein E4G96_01960 [Chrysiogenales bacterium]|nr:MAG: hypothetical protein E4G96_01960 [Chrysiogenales bacterium]